MFFIKSKLDKATAKATELLHLGQKVYDYRYDILPPSDVDELKGSMEHLREILNSKEKTVESIDKGMVRLDKIAKRCGGDIYPVRFLPDNIELILVATILALGIRTFFFQPFTIPTNSMYPSYYGMTPKVYTEETAEPGFMERVFRTIVLGSKHFKVSTKAGGELTIPLFAKGNDLSVLGGIRFEKARGTRLLIVPVPNRLYTFYVGKEAVKVKVPWDFSLEDVILEAYYPQYSSFREVLKRAIALGQVTMTEYGPAIKTGIKIKPNESVLNFDILSGDMLFVDRISYHFRKPKIGEPIVFPTERIEGMRRPDGSPEERYFIKRLVGIGGDILEVKEPILYRNGAPIEGAKAFELNHQKESPYRGYAAAGALSEGRTVVVPEGYVYAMGDNSYNSADSRFWGPVPEREVIGKAMLIFYPFTKRWGFSH